MFGDDDENEFIVGSDVLATLGIDVDRQREQLVASESTGAEDLFECSDEIQIGVECDADMNAAVDELVDKAVENGFPRERRDSLLKIALMFDIWRLQLGEDPPAKVPPLVIHQKDGAKPQRCKARQYPPHQREFLRDFNTTLERMGWIYENPQSRWASPALPVKKPNSEEYRQTSDYRAENAEREAAAGAIPIIRVITEHVRGMVHFGLFDFLKGFWLLPLARGCQEFLSYMTDSKVYIPTRVPQG
ncbi:LOW QUALITY PROTEIN: hypothetical protein PHMEG_00012737 [Phytophthora megakarya]|uniref:Reverse transcriptase n=1 Tax=Phytophthora megakarya TaxID=4795 RepID=A0A225W7Z9_9STRA|nr:LOW QUALITY PROTEIN: hypothetical protein PHMEG_00012737 [Phytophthora megakarya]